MNVRFWGGWFLVVMGISIVLMMGCEKGALGVKSATVMGKIVDKDSPGIGVANASVRMISIAPVGGSQLVQGYTQASTVTNANGEFVFENVNPDNVVFEFEANGYAKMQHPQVTASASDTSDVASEIKEVYIKSGSMTNLGILTMQKISNPLPEFIDVRSIIIRDGSSLKQLPGNTEVTINFNSQSETLTANEWYAGKKLNGDQIRLQAETMFQVTAVADAKLYRVYTGSMSGAASIQTEIILTPVTYDLVLRCINVPDYITGGVVNIYAETPATATSPAQVLATQDITNLGSLGAPNLPAVISLSGLALPINLRIQIRGYQDEVMTIDSQYLTAGDQGNYRIDIDFLANNGVTTFNYNPLVLASSKASMFDNMIRRDVALVVAGPHFSDTNSVAASISLPHSGRTYYNTDPFSATPPNESYQDEPVNVVFSDTAVGYSMNWTATVMGRASGTYSISSEEGGTMIDMPTELPASTLLIGVNATNPAEG